MTDTERLDWLFGALEDDGQMALFAAALIMGKTRRDAVDLAASGTIPSGVVAMVNGLKPA